MPDTYITGADQLRAMHDALKAAPKKLRKEVVKQLRTAVKPVTREVQDTVRSSESRVVSVETSGRARRAAHALNMTRGLSDETARKRAEKNGTSIEIEKAAHRVKQAAKAASGAGLRDTIARAVSASVSASGPAGVNATWRTRADRMPNKQRKLPKNYNSKKGWRHPVFGNREVWVTQLGSPDFFDGVIRKHQDELESKVYAAIEALADAVAREVH